MVKIYAKKTKWNWCSPDLLQLVDGGAAAGVAAVAGQGAVEEAGERDERGEERGAAGLRQLHAPQHARNLLLEVGVLLPLKQLPLPQVQWLLQ